MSGAARVPDPRLADWVDGTLPPREHDRFVAELRVNPQLRADLAAYERTVATLRAAYAPTAADAAAAQATGERMAARVLATLAQAPAARPTLGNRSPAAWAWALSLAAAVLACAFLVDRLADAPTGPGADAVVQLAPQAAAPVPDAKAGAGARLPAEGPQAGAAGAWRDQLGGALEVAGVGSKSAAPVAEQAERSLAQAAASAAVEGDRELSDVPDEAKVAPQPPAAAPDGAARGMQVDKSAPPGAQTGAEPGTRGGADQPAFDSARWSASVGLGGLPPAAEPQPGAAPVGPPSPGSPPPAADAPAPETRLGFAGRGGAGGGVADGAPGQLLPEVRLQLPAAAAPGVALRRAVAAERSRALAADATADTPRWVEIAAGSPVAGAPAAGAPTSGSDDFYLGPSRRQPTATVDEVWLVEGSREQVGQVLGRLAAAAREHGAVLVQGEVQVPPAMVTMAVGEPPPAADGPADRMPPRPRGASPGAGPANPGPTAGSRSAAEDPVRERAAGPAPGGPAAGGPGTQGPATGGPGGPALRGAGGPPAAKSAAKDVPTGGLDTAGAAAGSDRVRILVRLQPAPR